MKLLSLFGLDARLRRLRIAAGEGALAAEDRARLLRLAWEEEKARLRGILLLAIAVIGLTTVAVTMLSAAIVVQFWDTPYRIAASWIVAAVWIVGWIAAAAGLMSALRESSRAFEPTRLELERDWQWLRSHFSSHEHGELRGPADRPEPTREELLARIATQRERIATLQTPAPPKGSLPTPPGSEAEEALSAKAVRLAVEHPVATGAAAAAVSAVIGPRRLLRWAAVILPIWWRMR